MKRRVCGVAVYWIAMSARHLVVLLLVFDVEPIKNRCSGCIIAINASAQLIKRRSFKESKKSGRARPLPGTVHDAMRECCLKRNTRIIIKTGTKIQTVSNTQGKKKN